MYNAVVLWVIVELYNVVVVLWVIVARQVLYIALEFEVAGQFNEGLK